MHEVAERAEFDCPVEVGVVGNKRSLSSKRLIQHLLLKLFVRHRMDSDQAVAVPERFGPPGLYSL